MKKIGLVLLALLICNMTFISCGRSNELPITTGPGNSYVIYVDGTPIEAYTLPRVTRGRSGMRSQRKNISPSSAGCTWTAWRVLPRRRIPPPRGLFRISEKLFEKQRILLRNSGIFLFTFGKYCDKIVGLAMAGKNFMPAAQFRDDTDPLLGAR